MKILKFIFAALVVASLAAIHAAAAVSAKDEKSYKAGAVSDVKSSLDFLSLKNINKDLEQIKFANGRYFKIGFGVGDSENQTIIISESVNGINFRQRGYITYKTHTKNPAKLTPAQMRKGTNLEIATNQFSDKVIVIEIIYVEDEYKLQGLGTLLTLAALWDIQNPSEIFNSSCVITKAHQNSQRIFDQLGFETDTPINIYKKYNCYDVSEYNRFTDQLKRLLETKGHTLFDKALNKLKTKVK